MGFQEQLLRYFNLDMRPLLTPSELTEAAVLRDVLRDSEAAVLLKAEKEFKWGMQD